MSLRTDYELSDNEKLLHELFVGLRHHKFIGLLLSDVESMVDMSKNYFTCIQREVSQAH